MKRTATSIPACVRMQSTTAHAETPKNLVYEDGEPPLEPENKKRPLPPPSAKVAALHARLSLSSKLPLETLARTLVTPSADSNPAFNNGALARIGSDLLNYHVSEHLICTYPRLPMAVFYACIFAYAGPDTLHLVGRDWGVQPAYAPGRGVDVGLLQYQHLDANAESTSAGKTTRNEAPYFRRGMASRVVYDDEFGDTIKKSNLVTDPQPMNNAYASFVTALIGAVYLHGGRAAAKTFIQQHILSRHLDLSTLFEFSRPVRDLARLCAREDFEPPVARILSETGRHSRSPVFVVGIYSGREKLGEAPGASLNEGKIRASVAALKAWYLYSPGQVTLPSDMEVGVREGAKREWEPIHVDLGEIVA
ncbi:54S ribosomal protein L3 mitochondrial [Ciborinia camelliae]|nr:54S ribosomal protein L3 mitochondrial [Ciborinia camelliae]